VEPPFLTLLPRAINLLEIVKSVVGPSDREVRGYDCDRETVDAAAAYIAGSDVNTIGIEKCIPQFSRNKAE
jgi:hypothetical protein